MEQPVRFNRKANRFKWEKLWIGKFEQLSSQTGKKKEVAKMIVRIHLDHKKYKSKPQKNEVVRISNRITHITTDCEVKEFIEEVGNNGQTFMPALMVGKRISNNFQGQQVYALDFDNGITYEEFMKRACELELYPAFVYKTFSYTKKNPKFRAVYINDCMFKEQRAVNILLKMLMYIYPEADQVCSDAARMFFGGKGNLYVNENATINVRDVGVCLQAYVAKKDNHNYIRNMKRIGNELGIRVEKGILRILSECSDVSNFGSCPIYILGVNQISSLYYYIEEQNNAHAPEEYAPQKNERLIQHKSIKDIVECCPLAKDFYEKELDHNLKFLLATNYIHIKGGKKLFFKGIDEHIEKWEADWKTIVINHYEPQSCKNGKCPYIDQCKCKNMCEKLERKISLIKKDSEYISLGEGEALLGQYITESVNNKRKDINLIKAQTALGKTYAYCELASQRDKDEKPLMIALPTTKLQNEVYEELLSRNLEVYKTLSIKSILEDMGMDELLSEVQQLYEKGLGSQVKTKIRKFLEENNELYPLQKEQLQEYLDTKNNLIVDKIVVTTHAMLLRLPESVLLKYEIIVDEDILMTIFKNTGSITFRELEKFMKSNYISASNSNRLAEIMKMPMGAVDFTKLNEMIQDDLEKMYSDDIIFNGSIQDFLKSSTFHMNLENECINYFTDISFPRVPMTIISATLNRSIYETYFRDRDLEIKEVPLIRYTGVLKQYTAHSMSRSFINGVGEDIVKRSIYNITKLGDDNIITFKMLDKNKSIYLGKTEGYNELKGKDICVIGTPHNVPFIYKLIGKHLGYDVSSNMNLRKVKNDYYTFQMMTFENRLMQNLQFYFLESELEQAIGRARLLRFDCTVYLFSNYPCRQAEIIQDEYLLSE